MIAEYAPSIGYDAVRANRLTVAAARAAVSEHGIGPAAKLGFSDVRPTIGADHGFDLVAKRKDLDRAAVTPYLIQALLPFPWVMLIF